MGQTTLTDFLKAYSMQCIVLTGGIACGKSAAEKCFLEFGVPVIDADIIAKELTQQGSRYYQQIIAHFGTDFCQSDHTLNRKALARYIFQNPTEKKWLETLLHPPILDQIAQHIQTLKEKLSAPYCLILLPLLAEIRERPVWIDAVIVMLCPPAVQLQRLLEREPWDDLLSAQLKIQAQASTNQRLHLADYTLHNDGTLADLKTQVYHLHQRLLHAAST